MSRLPSLRGLAIDVLGQAESIGHDLAVTVADISPRAMHELVDAAEQVPALIGRLAATLGGVDRLLAAFDQVRANAATEVALVEQTRLNAEDTVNGAAQLVHRLNRLVDQAGNLLNDVEAPIRGVLPALNTLAEASEPELAELIVDLARRWPGLLTQMTDEVVPALSAMHDAVPDLVLLRELGQRLEPLVTEASHTMSGLPGARRARGRGSRNHEESGG